MGGWGTSPSERANGDLCGDDAGLEGSDVIRGGGVFLARVRPRLPQAPFTRVKGRVFAHRLFYRFVLFFFAHIMPLRAKAARRRVPRDERDLTVDFFNAILPVTVGSDNQVVSVRVRALKNGGLSGALLYHVTLDYRDSAAAAENLLPATVVAKIMNAHTVVSPALRPTAMQRLMTVSAGYSDPHMMQMETQFYSELAQTFAVDAGVPTPRCYYTAITGRHNCATVGLFIAFRRREYVSNVVIMEDLTGAQFRPAFEPIDDVVAEQILNSAVKLHAHSAKLYASGVVKPLPSCFHLDLVTMRTGIQLAVKKHMIKSRFGVQTKRFKQLWADDGYDVLKDPEVFDALVALERHYTTKVEPLSRAMYARAPSLLHGDLHAGNFAYMPDGALRLLDWQMWGTGSPAWELAYFLNTNIEPGDVARDERLIRAYHTQFVTLSGLVEYKYSQFRRDVDIATLESCAALLLRQARFDTPAQLEKQMKTFMKVYVMETRQAIVAMDVKAIKRVRDIYVRDRALDLDLARYES